MKINIPSADEIIKKRGLQPGGAAQKHLADALVGYSNIRTPKQTGNFMNNVKKQNGGTEIYYPDQYARYLWYGVAMKGDKPTNKPLQYQEAPMRGKKWIERTWQADGNKILQEVANEAGGRVK